MRRTTWRLLALGLTVTGVALAGCADTEEAESDPSDPGVDTPTDVGPGSGPADPGDPDTLETEGEAEDEAE